MVKKFSCGKYGRQTLHFFPAPFRAPLRAFAGLVFPWQDDRVLVGDITDRGWCIPSGRVEPFETSVDAVRREAVEEAGAILECIQYIGCYQVCDRSETRWADCYVAHVRDLVDIGFREESRARAFMTMAELAERYHVWNELTEQVFRYSYEVYARARGLDCETLEG